MHEEKAIRLKKDPEVKEALRVVRDYARSFEGHHNGRVGNGIVHVIGNHARLARFAVLLGAELLVQNGYSNAQLSWTTNRAEEGARR